MRSGFQLLNHLKKAAPDKRVIAKPREQVDARQRFEDLLAGLKRQSRVACRGGDMNFVSRLECFEHRLKTIPAGLMTGFSHRSVLVCERQAQPACLRVHASQINHLRENSWGHGPSTEKDLHHRSGRSEENDAKQGGPAWTSAAPDA